MESLAEQILVVVTAAIVSLLVLSYNRILQGSRIELPVNNAQSSIISQNKTSSPLKSEDFSSTNNTSKKRISTTVETKIQSIQIPMAPLAFHKPVSISIPRDDTHQGGAQINLLDSPTAGESDSDYDDGYTYLIDNVNAKRSSLYLPTPVPKGTSPRSSMSFSIQTPSPKGNHVQLVHDDGSPIDPKDLQRLSTIQIEWVPPFKQSTGGISSSYLKQSRQFMEMSLLLPPVDHPDYSVQRTWLHHLVTHKFAIEPDFFARLGHVAHLIDIRPADQLLGPIGYIPGANWYPVESAHRIIQHFPRDSLIAVVCNSDSESRKVVKMLRADGYYFSAILNGGMKQWKVMGLSAIRDPSILSRAYQPVSYQHQQMKAVCPPAAPQTKVGHDNGDSAMVCCDSTTNQRHIMTIDRLSTHIGAGGIQWLKLAAFQVHGRLSCVDGRDNNAVIGTPGGDMGEFIVLLTVAEQLLNKEFSYNEVSLLFQRRLDDFGRFYMHTDQSCLARLIDMLDFPLNIREKIQNAASHFAIELFLLYLPVSQREEIIDLLINPDYVGCGHLKFLLSTSSQYKVRQQLVRDALRAFFTARFAGALECEFVVLPGLHQECGVANIALDEHVHSFTRIPLLPPTIQGQQIFVNHQQVTSYLRVELCQWLLTQTDIFQLSKLSGAALCPLADLLAQHHLDLTVSTLAKDLPLFTLQFDNKGSCEVTSHGLIQLPHTNTNTPQPPPPPLDTLPQPLDLTPPLSSSLPSLSLSSDELSGSTPPLVLLSSHETNSDLERNELPLGGADGSDGNKEDATDYQGDMKPACGPTINIVNTIQAATHPSSSNNTTKSIQHQPIVAKV